MPGTFSQLPEHIQNIILSKQFSRFLVLLSRTFRLTREQEDMLDRLIDDLLYGDVMPSGLQIHIQKRLGFDDQAAQECAKQIIANVVLPFPDYFDDQTALYQSLGGDPEKDLETSPVFAAIVETLTESFEPIKKEMETLNLEREKGAVRETFAHDLVWYFTEPDGDYKIAKNNVIIALLRHYDGYNEVLLGALYENEQEIGTGEITLQDGVRQKSTVAHWIKDFLGYSGGGASSIALANYLSQNKNISLLGERDKDAVRRLLEMFIVLKNFPDSLDSIPQDQWKIIPYYHTEEVSKLPQAQRVGSGTDFVVANTEPDPKLQTSPPKVVSTIAIVPTQAVVSAAIVSPAVESQPSQAISPIDFSAVTNAVIAKTGVILSNDVTERVKKILETRVRNVRNDIDTRGRLIASVAEGGAGLGAEEVDKMLAEAKNAQQMIVEGKIDEYALKKTDEKGVNSFGLDSRLRGNDIEERNDKEGGDAGVLKMVIKEVDGVPTLVEKIEKKGNGKKKAEETIHETPHEILHEAASPPLFVQSPSPAPPVPVPTHLRDAKEISVMVKTLETGLDPGLRRDDKAVGAAKKPIPDVKAPPRLVTVVDELRALSMKDIRRISKDSKAACQKIVDKINALAKESLSKRAEAINAWKESPAYALYLEIGQLNIDQDMARLVEERKAAGKEYLTAEEFDALLDLNEKLRF